MATSKFWGQSKGHRNGGPSTRKQRGWAGKQASESRESTRSTHAALTATTARNGISESQSESGRKKIDAKGPNKEVDEVPVRDQDSGMKTAATVDPALQRRRPRTANTTAQPIGHSPGTTSSE
eukprot:7870406-Pyramimonas_sp.AAC.1